MQSRTTRYHFTLSRSATSKADNAKCWYSCGDAEMPAVGGSGHWKSLFGDHNGKIL